MILPNIVKLCDLKHYILITCGWCYRSSHLPIACGSVGWQVERLWQETGCDQSNGFNFFFFKAAHPCFQMKPYVGPRYINLVK